jgi:hypothetical protein
VRIYAPETRAEVEVGAALRAFPVGSRVEQGLADAPTLVRLRNYQVLQPATPSVPDREVVFCRRGHANNPVAIHRKQNVGILPGNGVAEPVTPPLRRVAMGEKPPGGSNNSSSKARTGTSSVSTAVRIVIFWPPIIAAEYGSLKHPVTIGAS